LLLFVHKKKTSFLARGCRHGAFSGVSASISSAKWRWISNRWWNSANADDEVDVGGGAGGVEHGLDAALADEAGLAGEVARSGCWNVLIACR